ncbi:hypothetical protein SAMN05443574_1406 [Haloarcula vallismortis]|uniref:Uncharacterized protein n=3 Tax=Haloarcula vallismortis TaxID=28442 RepID=M0JCS4_HALVA|nr:hypothetical protein C437_12246 [Haloarcula vallismortis ATCC 29715]SDX38142.1 hypothetical protein SAMN05443574_1406 [Haloarcula vallismortis]
MGAVLLTIGLYIFDEYRNINLLDWLWKAYFVALGVEMMYGFSQVFQKAETASEMNLVLLAGILAGFVLYTLYRIGRYLIYQVASSLHQLEGDIEQ